MKVLLLANHVNHGGITAHLLSLCRALNGKAGLEMVVASRGGDLEEEFLKAGARHICIPLSTKCEVSPKVFVSYVLLKNFLQGGGIDVLHAHTRVTQVLAALLSRSLGKPYLSTCHGYFKRRLSRRLFPCWGEKVVAVSDQVRAHLIGDFGVAPDRVELIYNGIDAGRFLPKTQDEREFEKTKMGLAPRAKVIGHIGRLSSVKGQRFLIEAVERLVAAGRDIRCLLIGDGPEEKNLRRLVSERRLEGVVFLYSSVKRTDLALSVMDVFVMPSLQEGLGLSILEAQASGVPVVASRVGGIPTAVDDRATGMLVPPADPAALSAAIAELLDDPALRAGIIDKAKRQVVEKFSLEAMAQKTLELYEKLAHRSREERLSA